MDSSSEDRTQENATGDLPLGKYPGGEPSEGQLRAITRAGHACVALCVIWFALLALLYPEPYARVYQVVVIHFFWGRVATAAAGLEWGFTKIFLICQSTLQDFAVIFYLYPLFVRGYHKAYDIPYIGKFLRDSHMAALRHRDRIAPYGMFGLFLFVLVPVSGSGPVGGVIVGYLLGLNLRMTFTVVMASNLFAVATWIWFYETMLEFDNRIAYGIVAVLLGGAVVGFVFSFLRSRFGRSPAAKGENGET